MDLERSVLRGSRPAMVKMKILHEGSHLAQVSLTRQADGREQRTRVDYQIGCWTRAEVGGLAMSARPVWKGSTLVVEARVSTGAGELRLADHWTLSEDGATLTMAHPDDDLAGQVSLLRREA